MQCFICVTYMFFICSAYPRRDVKSEQRSLFHDVIESLKIRAQLPEDTNRNDENNLGQIYERYGYENEDIHLPNDAEFIPRRNDRIALPSLKYRLPKSLTVNETSSIEKSKDNDLNEKPKQEEIIIFISTSEPPPKPTTQKNKRKPSKQPGKEKNPNLGSLVDDGNKSLKVPIVNTMADESHIGNKDYHMVVTPNIVVNFRTNENYKQGTVRIEDGKNASSIIPEIVPQNVFNIHQEVKLEKGAIDAEFRKGEAETKKVKQDIKVVARDVKPKIDEDMMMCETATVNDQLDDDDRSGRSFRNVFQILFSI
ncbi:uncharacterized protein LOC133519712 [Cydia pomonella]|uniref:uncharacterized protein LOC133519712 n=1 Tax=Cydia pomonella TaxID=82600 RepID=UPI002ADDF5F1|nr:uncharacterized protein LOC133519712 [Cydia pomonella]XP_061709760.1 uncharacterized protein LOC133519712 [Cydia pomonella]